MRDRKSIKVNAALNAAKTLLGIIFPLITYPYLARVIGAELMGKTAYGNSVVAYFQLVATFGLTTYAIRELSAVRGNPVKSAKLTSELFSLSVTLSLVSYFLLAVFVCSVPKMHPYRVIVLIQGLTILFSAVGMDWMNTVYEDYLYITIRTLVMQITFLFLLFLFVKGKSDFITGVVLTSALSGGVCIANFLHMRRYQKPVIVCNKQIFRHLRYMSVFFINAVAVQIYVNADTTMLGWMRGDYTVGIYGAATKVYTTATLLVTSVYNVTIPRLSYYFSQSDEKEYFGLLTNVISAIGLFLLPTVAGMMLFADTIICVLAGNEFSEAACALKILSAAMFFAVAGGIVTQCLNVTAKREKNTAFATIVTAVENIVLNIFFIDRFAQNGAAETTVIAQATVFVYCAWKSRDLLRKVSWKHILRNGAYAVFGIGAVFWSKYFALRIGLDTAESAVMIPVCVVLYGICLLVFRNPIATDMYKKIRRKK